MPFIFHFISRNKWHLYAIHSLLFTFYLSGCGGKSHRLEQTYTEKRTLQHDSLATVLHHEQDNSLAVSSLERWQLHIESPTDSLSASAPLRVEHLKTPEKEVFILHGGHATLEVQHSEEQEQSLKTQQATRRESLTEQKQFLENKAQKSHQEQHSRWGNTLFWVALATASLTVGVWLLKKSVINPTAR